MPRSSTFAAGRRTNNAAVMVLGLANYARSQAVSEGTVYRLNFDTTNGGSVWLTQQREGTFQPPLSDYGQHFPLPDGVRMTVDVAPGSVVVPIVSPAVQQTTATPTQLFGQPVGTPNELVQVPHVDGGTYVEVQESGRTDPCRIHLSDDAGHTVDLGAATATDVVHVLKPGEL